MFGYTNQSLKQNGIEVPKEVQFYVTNRDGLSVQSPESIFVTKEIKELVETSGLFREEDKMRFVQKIQPI